MHLKTLWGIGLILALVACSAETPSTSPAALEIEDSQPISEETISDSDNDPIKILAFGDSLTDGFGVEPEMAYPAQLERKLHGNGLTHIEVVNGGISGETSSGGLSRVDWMLNLEPDIVIVTTGGNDGLRGVDLELTRSNIDQIVADFQAGGAIVVVGGMQIIQNLGETYTEEFQQIYPDVAAKHNTILIPFFLEGVAADPELNQPDFIHPTAEGYAIIVDNIYPFVEEALTAIN